MYEYSTIDKMRSRYTNFFHGGALEEVSGHVTPELASFIQFENIMNYSS